ncbi:MAG: hypothetical protein WCI05_04150 [Myxococcales bacterium]
MSIVEQSLADSLERLRELPSMPRVRELRNRALAYDRAVRSWVRSPPSDEQRSALVRLVLDLNMEVMEVGREQRD